MYRINNVLFLPADADIWPADILYAGAGLFRKKGQSCCSGLCCPEDPKGAPRHTGPIPRL